MKLEANWLNPRKQNWKPRRRGNVYCSPACGHGCTWEAHQNAQKEARKLARQLGGKWKPRVWENGGWHFSAQLKGAGIACEVHRFGLNCFWADLQTPDEQWHAEAKTPQTALKAAIALVHKHITRAQALLVAVNGTLCQIAMVKRRSEE